MEKLLDVSAHSQQETKLSTASCVIVIPCYNESNRLRRDLFSNFLREHEGVRFLFVNDGSRDGTLDLLEDMRSEHPDRIGVLNNTVNGGKGSAIRDGMLAAMGPGTDANNSACDLVGFWDADLATPLNEIPAFIDTLERNRTLKMVFGARIRLLGRTIHRKAARHYAGRLFATAASQTLRIPIYDTQCGAKLFRVTPDLRAVLRDPFQSKWIFDVEILARFVQQKGRRYCIDSVFEYPLRSWEDVGGSKLKSFDFIRAAGDLWTIYRNHLAGVKD